ncbi:MAG: hypothetical protein LBG52_03405 [Candidatus Peribacteria bacterium]|nr:hypothetical protein [Candidatus Peribacteria bacterium]
MFLEDSVAYKTSPLCSREVEELLRRSKLFLAAEEYFVLRAGDSIKVIETYFGDKSFFPLCGENVKKEFFIHQRGGVLYLKAGSMIGRETSYNWLLWVLLVYFVTMVALSFVIKNGNFFWDMSACLILFFLVCGLCFAVVVSMGYLFLWIFICLVVEVIVTRVVRYLRNLLE